MAEGEDEGPGGSFTTRLRWLFESVPDPATGRPYTFSAAAKKIRERIEELPADEQPGRTISVTYLWQLHSGDRTNPTRRHLESLAELFGVPVSYLLDEAADPTFEADLQLAIALRTAGIDQVAFRARGLSPGSIAQLLTMIDHVRRLEGLDPQSDAGGTAGTSEPVS